MYEDIGVEIREEPFGNMVLRTYAGDVLSLDLYQTPDLVCRGVYLPTDRREGTLAIAQLELVADRDAQDEVSRRLAADGRGERGSLSWRPRIWRCMAS